MFTQDSPGVIPRATARVAPTLYEQDSLNRSSYMVGATLAVALDCRLLTSMINESSRFCPPRAC
jgi:hypothetical protein